MLAGCATSRRASLRLSLHLVVFAIATAAVVLGSSSAAVADGRTPPLVRRQTDINKHDAPVDMHMQALEIRGDALLQHADTSNALMQLAEQQPSPFKLQTLVGQDHLKIPARVMLTGAQDSIKDVLEFRDLTSLGIHSGMQVRYFNNSACRAYLEKNVPDMVKYFDSEKHGAFRGDICRTAVLAREGGFYVDLDLEILSPLQQLVDDETTFMTARSDGGDEGCLNAIIASTPNNPVMLNTLAEMGRWYRNETTHEGFLGTTTMQRGLGQVMATACPEHQWKNAHGGFQCGPQHAIRLFQEQRMSLSNCAHWGPKLCPSSRAKSQFVGLQFGLVDMQGLAYQVENKRMPTSEDIARLEKRLLGWSRWDGCKEWGCGLTKGVAAAGAALSQRPPKRASRGRKRTKGKGTGSTTRKGVGTKLKAH